MPRYCLQVEWFDPKFHEKKMTSAHGTFFCCIFPYVLICARSTATNRKWCFRKIIQQILLVLSFNLVWFLVFIAHGFPFCTNVLQFPFVFIAREAMSRHLFTLKHVPSRQLANLPGLSLLDAPSSLIICFVAGEGTLFQISLRWFQNPKNTGLWTLIWKTAFSMMLHPSVETLRWIPSYQSLKTSIPWKNLRSNMLNNPKIH